MTVLFTLACSHRTARPSTNVPLASAFARSAASFDYITFRIDNFGYKRRQTVIPRIERTSKAFVLSPGEFLRADAGQSFGSGYKPTAAVPHLIDGMVDLFSSAKI